MLLQSELIAFLHSVSSHGAVYIICATCANCENFLSERRKLCSNCQATSQTYEKVQWNGFSSEHYKSWGAAVLVDLSKTLRWFTTVWLLVQWNRLFVTPKNFSQDCEHLIHSGLHYALESREVAWKLLHNFLRSDKVFTINTRCAIVNCSMARHRMKKCNKFRLKQRSEWLRI